MLVLLREKLSFNNKFNKFLVELLQLAKWLYKAGNLAQNSRTVVAFDWTYHFWHMWNTSYAILIDILFFHLWKILFAPLIWLELLCVCKYTYIMCIIKWKLLSDKEKFHVIYHLIINNYSTSALDYPGYQRFFSRTAGIFGVDRRPTHLRP